LEMRREKLRALAPLEGPPPAPSDLRVRQLRARDLLRGDLEGPDLEEHVAESVLTTRLDRVLNWGRPTRSSRSPSGSPAARSR